MNGRRWRAMLRIGGIGLCAAIAASVVIRTHAAQEVPRVRGEQPAAPAVPVVVAKAERQDVPVYADGIGMVQAYQAVLVRSRVDGTLVSFPVTEGREVKRGEVIAVIDPRPFQAVLDQAMAKKTQDEAQLANARLDLARFAPLVGPGFASRQQYDTQQALVSQFVAAVAGDIASIQAAQLNLSFCYIHPRSMDGLGCDWSILAMSSMPPMQMALFQLLRFARSRLRSLLRKKNCHRSKRT